MSQPIRSLTLCAAVGAALLGAGAPGAGHAAAETAAPAAASASGGEPYIILFDEPGLLDYDGRLAGLQATAPTGKSGQRKLDGQSNAAVAYGAHLLSQRRQYVAAIESALRRPLVVTHHYAVTANGVAASLSAAEAAQIATLPGVKSVRPAGSEPLVTYRGPTFIGADTLWNGSASPTGAGTRGQGIVAAIIDTGNQAGHPSFADDPSCGFSASHPKNVAVDCLTTDEQGRCNGPNPNANTGNGHGVHTATTVGGNTIDNTATPAPNLPDGVTMSGVAPCAQLNTYKACETTSCAGAETYAGIQNAILDQADVLSYSIGGGSDPWRDGDRDFLDAVRADIFVAAAAGNTGVISNPVGAVTHLGPWVMTVAASTQDQFITTAIRITGPGAPPAPLDQPIRLYPGSASPPLTTSSGSTVATYPPNMGGCSAGGGIPAGTFNGKVALLQRSADCGFVETIANASAAGAQAVLIANNEPGTFDMNTDGQANVPALGVEGTVGDALIGFVAQSAPTAVTGNLLPVQIVPVLGDQLGYFSLRGPTKDIYQNLTKPNISAPGVNIYAGLEASEGYYGFLSGTSMATPHVAGAGALVRALRPDWTVQEVKSALETTAKIAGVKEDGTTPWTIDDVGGGRIDLSKAALAGLTLDETFLNFLAANPRLGTMDQRELNVPALRSTACAPQCTWKRTVTNRLLQSGSWNTSFEAPAGDFTASVSPPSFTLAPGASQVLTITASQAAGDGTAMSFGYVSLTEANGQAPAQHLTVAVSTTGLIDKIFADGFETP